MIQGQSVTTEERHGNAFDKGIHENVWLIMLDAESLFRLDSIERTEVSVLNRFKI
jgi:hypothetical protein